MLICEAPIGTKIVFGTRGDDDLVWRKVTDDLDFISERSAIRMGFDNDEPNSESRARRRFGNNFFPHSNILQFLNSTHPGRDWFVPQHEYDTEPAYGTPCGFLSVFTKSELDSIVEREITVAVPLGSRKKFGNTYQLKCKVCLPSASEIGGMDSDGTIMVEGGKIPELARFFSDKFRGRAMTRTGITDAGHIVTYYGGDLGRTPANTRCNAYPMIRLRGDIEVTDEADADGLHYVKTNDDGFMENFLSIIKL